MDVLSHVVMYTAIDSQPAAEKLALLIVESKLAACVNVISGAKSFYYWEDKLDQSVECLLMIKTTSNAIKPLETFIRENHEYTEPEIIALPIVDGSASYLNWLSQNVQVPQ